MLHWVHWLTCNPMSFLGVSPLGKAYCKPWVKPLLRLANCRSLPLVPFPSLANPHLPANRWGLLLNTNGQKSCCCLSWDIHAGGLGFHWFKGDFLSHSASFATLGLEILKLFYPRGAADAVPLRLSGEEAQQPHGAPLAFTVNPFRKGIPGLAASGSLPSSSKPKPAVPKRDDEAHGLSSFAIGALGALAGGTAVIVAQQLKQLRKNQELELEAKLQEDLKKCSDSDEEIEAKDKHCETQWDYKLPEFKSETSWWNPTEWTLETEVSRTQTDEEVIKKPLQVKLYKNGEGQLSIQEDSLFRKEQNENKLTVEAKNKLFQSAIQTFTLSPAWAALNNTEWTMRSSGKGTIFVEGKQRYLTPLEYCDSCGASGSSFKQFYQKAIAILVQHKTSGKSFSLQIRQGGGELGFETTGRDFEIELLVQKQMLLPEAKRSSKEIIVGQQTTGAYRTEFTFLGGAAATKVSFSKVSEGEVKNLFYKKRVLGLSCAWVKADCNLDYQFEKKALFTQLNPQGWFGKEFTLKNKYGMEHVKFVNEGSKQGYKIQFPLNTIDEFEILNCPPGQSNLKLQQAMISLKCGKKDITQHIVHWPSVEGKKLQLSDPEIFSLLHRKNETSLLFKPSELPKLRLTTQGGISFSNDEGLFSVQCISSKCIDKGQICEQIIDAQMQFSEIEAAAKLQFIQKQPLQNDQKKPDSKLAAAFHTAQEGLEYFEELRGLHKFWKVDYPSQANIQIKHFLLQKDGIIEDLDAVCESFKTIFNPNPLDLKEEAVSQIPDSTQNLLLKVLEFAPSGPLDWLMKFNGTNGMNFDSQSNYTTQTLVIPLLGPNSEAGALL